MLNPESVDSGVTSSDGTSMGTTPMTSRSVTPKQPRLKPLTPSERKHSRHWRRRGSANKVIEVDDSDEKLFSRLQKMFVNAEEEGLGGLDIDNFKHAIRTTVGKNTTEDEIELLFMKVDANCDGVVDWEEYVTYNLLEYKEKTLMFEMLRDKPFPNDIREIECRHRDVIIKIAFWPALRKRSNREVSVDLTKGKYITLSKEGLLGCWSLSMRNLKYFHLSHHHTRNTQPLFTDLVVMYNVNMIAVASTDRDIIFFEITPKTICLKYWLSGLDHCVTAMDYWVSPKDLNCAMLAWGDSSGAIHSIQFESALRGGPFGPVAGKKNSWKRMTYLELLKGLVVGCDAKAVRLQNIHDDWVGMVKYIPELECFMSSCNSNSTALFFGDFYGKKSTVYFKVHKGVLCFDFSAILNIIVTGGMDYMLRVWNPYVNNKAIVLLKGHSKPINHVLLNGSKSQVISIDKGRSLRVFDLRDQTCLQHVSGRIIKLNPFPISAVFFNPALKTIILGAHRLVMLEKKDEETIQSDILSHNKPVVSAIYNHIFQFVVSACHDSVVSIWDINTGDKVMQFLNAHSTVERGVTVPVEITAISFDTNGRRLITGARNGTVHIWNFNNGSCLQKFFLPDNSDVTDLVCTKHKIYVTGWGKTVFSFTDGKGQEHCKGWKVCHKEDILSIAYLPQNIIATGSYDGNVTIWFRETGHVYCRLNASESCAPIGENMKESAQPVLSPSLPASAELQTKGSVCGSEEREEDDEENARRRKHTKLSGNLGLGILSRFKETAVADISEDVDTPQEAMCEHPLLQALDKEVDERTKTHKYSRDDYDKVFKSYESAVEKILFLETRESFEKDTAILLTSGAEGWIRAWSIHHDGGLLGQFNAAHSLGDGVLAMTTDSENVYLFTGDTQGYLKIWHIQEYCRAQKLTLKERKEQLEKMKKKFTFFRVESYQNTLHGGGYAMMNILREQSKKRPPPSSSNPDATLKYPLLLNSFKAHLHTINSVDFADNRDIIITGSGDCSIRLWTIDGQHIGTFGDTWPSLPAIVTPKFFVSQLPPDIRRVGSAKTLKVMHGGKTPMWQGALKIIQQRGFQRLRKQFDHLQTKEDLEPDLVESNLQASNILGKSYKRKVRHKMPPTLPKFIEVPGSFAVYHTLPFVELTSEDEVNQVVRKLMQKRAESVTMRTRDTKKKSNIPHVVALFNNAIAKPAPSLKKSRPKNRIKKVYDRFQKSPEGQGQSGTASRSKKPIPIVKIHSKSKTVVADETASRDPEEGSETDPEENSPTERRCGSSMSAASPTISKQECRLRAIKE